jgi:hypothetical protein
VAFFDFLSIIAILGGLIAAPFMIVGWGTRAAGASNLSDKISSFFIVAVLIGLLSSGISAEIGKYRLGDFLDKASPRCAVSIDGTTVKDAGPVIDTLRQVGPLPAHHSGFGRIFVVVISDPPRKVSLWVARDVSDPYEYWVFFPSPSKLAFRARLKTDIGHVRTTVFDGYGS